MAASREAGVTGTCQRLPPPLLLQTLHPYHTSPPSVPPTFLGPSSPRLDSPPSAGFMGCVWRVSCFLAATENPYGGGNRGGGAGTLLPHPQPPPLPLYPHIVLEGRGGPNQFWHAWSRARASPDLPVVSLEESKVYDRV